MSKVRKIVEFGSRRICIRFRQLKPSDGVNRFPFVGMAAFQSQFLSKSYRIAIPDDLPPAEYGPVVLVDVPAARS